MARRKTLDLGSARTSDLGGSSEEQDSNKKSPKEEVEKVRVTHYLSTENLGSLEEVYDEIRGRLPYADKTKVKKSHLVDFALELLLEEYKSKGDKSRLSRKYFK